MTRFYRLSRWDADDVIQTTWLRFLQHGHTMRDPSALSAWLMTTARRLCLRALQSHVREAPEDDAGARRGRATDELDSRVARLPSAAR